MHNEHRGRKCWGDFLGAGRSHGFPILSGESSPSPLSMLNLARESLALQQVNIDIWQYSLLRLITWAVCNTEFFMPTQGSHINFYYIGNLCYHCLEAQIISKALSHFSLFLRSRILKVKRGLESQTLGVDCCNKSTYTTEFNVSATRGQHLATICSLSVANEGKKKPKTFHNKGKSKPLLIVRSSDLSLKRRLVIPMETQDSTSTAVLGLNRTVPCPALYCYISQ